MRLEVSPFGLDGLSAIRQRRPDLILLDMHPPNTRGQGLLCHIKQEGDVADIPVLVLSAGATTARMQEALTLGAGHCLNKPMDIAAFLETRDAALHDVETRARRDVLMSDITGENPVSVILTAPLS